MFFNHEEDRDVRTRLAARRGRERSELRTRAASGLPGPPETVLSQRLWRTAPCCESLRCFEEAMTARGLERKPRVPETVAVRSIVGRCGSFDAGFLPVCSCSAERWKRVYEAFLEGKPLPPVELYKVGGVYFIVDGNHRVSVARYRGAMAVDAVVTEFA